MFSGVAEGVEDRGLRRSAVDAQYRLDFASRRGRSDFARRANANPDRLNAGVLRERETIATGIATSTADGTITNSKVHEHGAHVPRSDVTTAVHASNLSNDGMASWASVRRDTPSRDRRATRSYVTMEERSDFGVEAVRILEVALVA